MQTAEVVAFASHLILLRVSIRNIALHENEVLQYGLENLKNNSINIIGDPRERGSVLCFTLKDIHPIMTLQLFWMMMELQ